MRILENFDLYGNLFYSVNDAITVIIAILFELAFIISILYFLYEYILPT
jgi:hypothetical protein